MNELEKMIAETEAASFRLRCMVQLTKMLCPDGLPSQNVALEHIAIHDAEYSDLLRLQGEARVCAMFDKMARLGTLAFHLNNSEPVSIEREARLPCGNADRIVNHEDGTITVVEVKAAGSRRDHAQGIGQVLLYSAAVRDTRPCQDVRGLLVVGGSPDKWVEAACRQAGIGYLAISNYAIVLEVEFAQAWLKGKHVMDENIKWQNSLT